MKRRRPLKLVGGATRKLSIQKHGEGDSASMARVTGDRPWITCMDPDQVDELREFLDRIADAPSNALEVLLENEVDLSAIRHFTDEDFEEIGLPNLLVAEQQQAGRQQLAGSGSEPSTPVRFTSDLFGQHREHGGGLPATQLETRADEEALAAFLVRSCHPPV